MPFVMPSFSRINRILSFRVYFVSRTRAICIIFLLFFFSVQLCLAPRRKYYTLLINGGQYVTPPTGGSGRRLAFFDRKTKTYFLSIFTRSRLRPLEVLLLALRVLVFSFFPAHRRRHRFVESIQPRTREGERINLNTSKIENTRGREERGNF